MNKQQEVFYETLQALNQIGILKHFMLIGSWAEFAYEQDYLRNFEANLQTRDLDFLLRNLALPKEKINLKQVLEDNYDFVASTDPITGITKFFKGGTLEIEFLVRELGAGSIEPYHARGLGIKVEGLRNMELLLDNPISCRIKDIEVIVPSPHAYALHKLLINKRRKPEKRSKDIRSVVKVLEAIKQIPGEVSFLRVLFDSLPPKQKKAIELVCDEQKIELI